MIIDNYGNIYFSSITHGGYRWHADEIFATAILKFIDKDFEVHRQAFRNEPIPNDPEILVYDVGLGKYDHHQKLENLNEDELQFQLRDDGGRRASFGLILKDFYKSIGLSDEEYEKLDRTFVRLIEDVDNGNFSQFSAYSKYFNNMNVDEKELKGKTKEEVQEYRNEKFLEMVDIAQKILDSKIKDLNNENIIDNSSEIKELFKETLANKFFIEKKDTLVETIQELRNSMEEDVFKYFERNISIIEEELNGKDSSYIDMINCLYPNKELITETISNFYQNSIDAAIEVINAKETIKEAYEKSSKNYILLKNGVPWKETICEINEENERQIDFVMIRNANQIQIQAVPISMEDKTLRIPFSEEIRGLSTQNSNSEEYNKSKEILDNYSSGIIFCHPSGYLASVKKFEDAVNLINKTMEDFENSQKIEIGE